MGGRYRARPVYGRVVHKPPMLRVQDVAERNRAFEEVARMYGTVQRGTEPRRRVTAFRLSGGGHIPSVALTPQSGSFQHLKVIHVSLFLQIVDFILVYFLFFLSKLFPFVSCHFQKLLKFEDLHL